ncbi:MAG: hypothetical protein WAK17_01500 [Candidatus Nitrosopolaris sp.]
MGSEDILSSIIPFAGSGVAGFFVGMFLRRVLKFLVIIIGSFLGAVFLVLLLCGPPASAKTLFLLGILGMRKDGVYFDGSNTTNRILDVLEEERPTIICIDELERMSRQFQNQLLNFLESGRIKVDQRLVRGSGIGHGL